LKEHFTGIINLIPCGYLLVVSGTNNKKGNGFQGGQSVRYPSRRMLRTWAHDEAIFKHCNVLITKIWSGHFGVIGLVLYIDVIGLMIRPN
jgi:hypothetical protein